MMRLNILILTLSAIAGLSACRRAEASREPDPAPARNPLEIAITSDLKTRIRIGEASMTSFSSTYTVSARVEADETRIARVGSTLPGRITALLAREGDVVKKGQLLATLTSTELTNVQLSFLKAHSQAMLSKRAVDRAHQLLDAGVIGAAELQRREAELSQAAAEMATLRGQLKVLGMPEEAADKLEETRQVDAASHITASIDGLVLERKATTGQVVMPAEALFQLADLSQVWVVADVPEQAAGTLREGQAVEAEIASLSGRIVRGRLSHVESILNPQTRTVRVRMDVDNRNRTLKPAMLATMNLREAPSPRRAVPATAVVRETNRDYVFARSGPGAFSLREVTLGPEFENMRVLESGLDPKTEIVLDGAFHLNNERKRLALQNGAK